MITKQELLERLNAKGIRIGGNPERMLTKFISMGLIKKPERFGLGKGKGIVSKFDENVIDDIKSIVEMKADGLTYTEIGEIIDHTNKEINSLLRRVEAEERELLSLSPDARKGKAKLSGDIIKHLAGVVYEELNLFFNDCPNKKTAIHSFVNCLLSCSGTDLIFKLMGLSDEDYIQYLEGKKEWEFLSPVTKLSPEQFQQFLNNGDITQEEINYVLKIKEVDLKLMNSMAENASLKSEIESLKSKEKDFAKGKEDGSKN